MPSQNEVIQKNEKKLGNIHITTEKLRVMVHED